jgi:RNA polymerase sigma-70 factor (ECF subfamily)
MNLPAGPARWTLAELYARFYLRVVAHAHGLLRDRESARDAAHDVFIRIVSDRSGVLALDEPANWILRVTTNLCLNRLRDDQRRRRILARNPPVNDVYPDVAEARAILGDVLRDVPDDLVDIAARYHVDEMTQEEISRSIGVPRRTVAHRLMTFQMTASGTARRSKVT